MRYKGWTAMTSSTAQADTRKMGSTTTPDSGTRVLALDAYRGLVIVVMTFVNYLSPVKDIPAWAKHWPENLEGYTFVDVVFPAFLFIVGVAIPFALQRRLDRGDSLPSLVTKIFARSAALVFLGVLSVNAHEYAPEAVLPKALWVFLTMVCAVAVWISAPIDASGARRKAHLLARVVGIVGLVALLAAFRGHDDDGHVIWLQHSYWGMLGMIGYAYFVASLVWLWLRDNSIAIVGVIALLIAWFIGDKHGVLSWIGQPVRELWNVGFVFGTNAATVLMGVLAGNCLKDKCLAPKDRVRWMLWLGVGLYVAGTLIRPLHGINKSAHTDAYALVTGGISCALFALVYWLMDVKRWFTNAPLLVAFGQNALLAYILPDIVKNGFGIFGVSIYWSNSGTSGAWCAAGLTVLLLALLWVLTKARLVMRL
jgi:heparan-alpha-glucosaminide N-acetyltransferase